MSFWTNSSVTAFAGSEDPERAVIDRARQIALEAISEGWAGPPYDPFELAQRLGIRVVARDDLYDACLRPEGRGLVLEYNASRPRGRVRYSVAHELAHTIFPDVRDQVRFRDAREHSGDSWQLEMLCNLAASELLMPAGTFPELSEEALDIENLMRLREKWDVSTEALMLRVARLTEQPATVFAASRSNAEDVGSALRVDYQRGSRSWQARLKRGARLPRDSAAYRCTAIGYTARGDEEWPAIGTAHVEAVGIPPYPGQRMPRVVGIVRPAAAVATRARLRLTFVRGDATQPHGDGRRLIAHVVNDKTPNWGGQFARALRDRYPPAQEQFRDWARRGLTLGAVHLADVDADLTVATMVAQRGFGSATRPRLRYDALRRALAAVAETALAQHASVHMPRIGAGIAGGAWPVIAELIDSELIGRDVPVTVYSLPGADWEAGEPAQQAMTLSA